MKSRNTFRAVSWACLALFGAGLGAPALAQPSSLAQSLLDDKFVFSLGVFAVTTDVKARLDGQSTTNPEVDFDRSFGKPSDATRFRVDGLWRITPTHHLRLMYFNNDTTRSRVLDEPVFWGDYTFAAGANVEAKSKYSVTALAYEYRFVRRPDYELAASLGVNYADISMKLSGAATVNGKPVSFASKEASAPAPLPLIGLRAGWVVAPQWLVDAHVQYFKAKVGEYDGSITDLRLGATWMFQRHFGVGIGYNAFHTNVDVSKSDFNGRLRWGYSGVQLFLTGSY